MRTLIASCPEDLTRGVVGFLTTTEHEMAVCLCNDADVDTMAKAMALYDGEQCMDSDGLDITLMCEQDETLSLPLIYKALGAVAPNKKKEEVEELCRQLWVRQTVTTHHKPCLAEQGKAPRAKRPPLQKTS